ncbi:hypothetical protein P8452_51192 [Trifolium repens]|nr:hypothetical protein P8452_51192 [Trifolium repens]
MGFRCCRLNHDLVQRLEAATSIELQITVRLANGKILLAEEDYVDYYHNIVTFKVKSDAKLRPLDIYSPLENLEGVEVVALERDFYTCKLSENCGLFCKDYPYFGCELLASSTCGGNQYVELLNVVSDMLSACRPNQTDTMVYVSVNYDRKVVRAENLSVDDKNFCSSWLVNDSEWTLMKPLIDSIGINANVPMYSIHLLQDAVLYPNRPITIR